MVDFFIFLRKDWEIFLLFVLLYFFVCFIFYYIWNNIFYDIWCDFFSIFRDFIMDSFCNKFFIYKYCDVILCVCGIKNIGKLLLYM